MKTVQNFEIWSEGFRITGQSVTAIRHAKVVSTSFEEAILILAIQNRDFYKYLDFHFNEDGTNYYRYWGCRLFDNEKDARKAFG